MYFKRSPIDIERMAKLPKRTTNDNAITFLRNDQPGSPTNFTRCDLNNSFEEENNGRPKIMKVTSSGEKIRYFIEPEDLKHIIQSQRSDKKFEFKCEQIKTKKIPIRPETSEQLQYLVPDKTEDLLLDNKNKSNENLQLHINIPQDSSDGLDDLSPVRKPISAVKNLQTILDVKPNDSVRRKRYTKKIKRSSSSSIREKFQMDAAKNFETGYTLKKVHAYTDISIKREREMLFVEPAWRENISNVLALAIFFLLFSSIYSFVDEMNRYNQKFPK